MEALNAWGMQDEEKENGEVIHRTLPWRKDEYTDIIKRVDKALVIRRKYGKPSEREANEKCLTFVKDEYIQYEDKSN